MANAANPIPLTEAVTQLYATFERYPLRSRIDACPCCRTAGETRHLHTKPLATLNAEDLSLFTFRAMTTVGDANDFRHFLPRILELLPNDFLVDPEVVLGKLQYAGWLDWPVDEVQALRSYLYSLWAWARRKPLDPLQPEDPEIGQWLCAIARTEPDIANYLDAWLSDPSQEAQAKLHSFQYQHFQATHDRRPPSAFWEGLDLQWNQVKERLQAPDQYSFAVPSPKKTPHGPSPRRGE